MDANRVGTLYKRVSGEVDDKGDRVKRQPKPILELDGVLDLMAQSTVYPTMLAGIEDSTHIFIAGYDPEIEPYRQKCDQLAFRVGEREFEVEYIDNPMEMGMQIEMYLKAVG